MTIDENYKDKHLLNNEQSEICIEKLNVVYFDFMITSSL